jgi:hypothetical protein
MLGVQETTICTHVLNWGGKGVESPVDDLWSGERKCLYAEAMHPRAPIAEHGPMLCRHKIYAGFSGRGLCRDSKVL